MAAFNQIKKDDKLIIVNTITIDIIQFGYIVKRPVEFIKGDVLIVEHVHNVYDRITFYKNDINHKFNMSELKWDRNLKDNTMFLGKYLRKNKLNDLNAIK